RPGASRRGVYVDFCLAVERASALAVLRLPPRLLRTAVGPSRRAPEGYALDLEGEVVLALMRLLGEKGIDHVEPKLSRRKLQHAARILEARVPGVVTREATLPGGAGPRRVRTYRPAGAPPGAIPGILWMHGGGFGLGSVESHDAVCRALGVQAGGAGAALGHRLAAAARSRAGRAA